MGKKDDEDNIEEIRKDDRNIEIARRRWEEDIEDPAIEHMRLIREDVEHDE